MGGWASDALSKRQGSGGWASQTLAGRGAPAADEPEDDGFKPWTGPAQIPLEQRTEVDARPWFDRALEGGRDAAYSAAGGVLSGLGMNPRQLLGDDVRNTLALANERSPVAAPIGKFAGELGGQFAAAPAALARAPIALGAAGGALSGLGNSDTDDWGQRILAATEGGLLGTAGGWAAGKLGSLLGRGSAGLADNAAQLDREALSQGLMHGGATRADLKRLDALGGREKFAEGAKRLGLTGRPAAVEAAAGRVVEGADTGRDAILQAAGPLQVDPMALGAAIERGGSAQLPNVAQGAAARVRGVVQGEADAARGMGTPAGGAPWDEVNKLRQFWGDKTNFASGTPENTARRGIYGAINDELGDAINLRTPGAGDEWRQLGADEHIGIQLGDIATAALDRGRQQGFGPLDAFAVGGGGSLGALLGGPGGSALGAAGGLLGKRALEANRHAIAGGLASAGAGLARGTGAAMGALGNAPLGAAVGASVGGWAADDAEAKSVAQQALNALHTQPQALGQYASQIAQAAASPDQGAVNTLMLRLVQTDPQFRRDVLPRLQPFAGGM